MLCKVSPGMTLEVSEEDFEEDVAERLEEAESPEEFEV